MKSIGLAYGLFLRWSSLCIISSGSLPTISYTFQVDNVYPASGSMNGGTIVTLTGDGFSTIPEDNVVHFGDTACSVLAATSTQLLVETGHGRRVHTISNNGVYPGTTWSN